MIVAFSTSSPMASVALFAPSGELLARGERMSAYGASAALLAQLDECLLSTGKSLDEATGFAADLGPGSFVGVRVGVTMAKTLAWTYGVPVSGAPSWRLIGSSEDRVVIPNKRNESFLFIGGDFTLVSEVSDAIGYGPSIETPRFPLAERMPIFELEWAPAETLIPFYAIPPAISQPKTPYREVAP